MLHKINFELFLGKTTISVDFVLEMKLNFHELSQLLHRTP